MHARAIYNVLTQGRTVQKSGSNPATPGKLHPDHITPLPKSLHWLNKSERIVYNMKPPPNAHISRFCGVILFSRLLPPSIARFLTTLLNPLLFRPPITSSLNLHISSCYAFLELIAVRTVLNIGSILRPHQKITSCYLSIVFSLNTENTALSHITLITPISPTP